VTTEGAAMSRTATRRREEIALGVIAAATSGPGGRDAGLPLVAYDTLADHVNAQAPDDRLSELHEVLLKALCIVGACWTDGAATRLRHVGLCLAAEGLNPAPITTPDLTHNQETTP
jgi:hypothetical protein